VVEMADRDEVIVHPDTAAAVDTLLRGNTPRGERREQGADGQIHVQAEAEEPARPPLSTAAGITPHGPARIYPYALSRDLLERVIRSLRLNARTVGGPEQADLIVALRARSDDLRLRRIMEGGGASLHFIKRNTANEMRRLLERTFHILEGVEGEEELHAMVAETEAAIERALTERVEVSLAPRPSALRRMQHRLIAGRGLLAESTGKEPQRHLVIRAGNGN
jgi:hypothetical protein